MEWSKDKILEYVQQGWTLSWDKTNQKYKLQKRINGKVKSYTLPKEFNEFCKRLKEEKELNKYLDIFKYIEEGASVDEVREKYKLEYEEAERVFKEYVEWKIKENKLDDLLFNILYELRSYVQWRIDDIEEIEEKIGERLDKASRMVRTAFGIAGLEFQCPVCRKTSTLKYDSNVKKWVCSNCGKIPF